jgi:hypothetical protein
VIHPGRIVIDASGAVTLRKAVAKETGDAIVKFFPDYASPEEVQGKRGDFRSSLYSLGCCLFELVTGQQPYAADSPQDVLDRHLRTPIPDPRNLREDIGDDAFCIAVIDLLRKDPDERVQSAAELRRRLAASVKAPSHAPTPPQSKTAARAGAPPARTAAALHRGAGTGRHAAPAPAKPLRRPAAHAAPPGRADRSARPGAAQRRLGAHGSGRHHLHGREGARRGHGLEADDLDGDAGEESWAAPKRSFHFTVGGCILGVGLAVLVFALSSNSVKRAEKRQVEQRAEFVRQSHEDAKKAIAAAAAEQEEKLRTSLGGARQPPSDPEQLRSFRDGLERQVAYLADQPGALALALELDKVAELEAKLPPKETEYGGSQVDFAAVKAEYQKHFDAGRLNAAVEVILNVDKRTEKTHREEIDALQKKAEDEMVRRWEEDQKKIQSLCLDAKPLEAQRVIDEVRLYADETIRRQIEKTEHEIRMQVVTTKPSTEDASAGEDSPKPGEGEEGTEAKSSDGDEPPENEPMDPEKRPAGAESGDGGSGADSESALHPGRDPGRAARDAP